MEDAGDQLKKVFLETFVFYKKMYKSREALLD